MPRSSPSHAEALAARPPDYFHVYAFNTLRQFGANFELLSSHLEWLGENGVGGLDRARAAAQEIAGGAKTMQFRLARAMARRRFDGLAQMLHPMAEAYDTAMTHLDKHIGHNARPEATGMIPKVDTRFSDRIMRRQGNKHDPEKWTPGFRHHAPTGQQA